MMVQRLLSLDGTPAPAQRPPGRLSAARRRCV
ncbi:Uncharacterised protein [Bordetella pertussis]|nr:Uncharacterised protein [Bordetella pertussis]